MDTCLGISKHHNKYGHGKSVNECKCSCSAGVESVDGITVLGKLQNECQARLVSYTGNMSSLDEETSCNSSQLLLAIKKKNCQGHIAL